MVDSFHLKGDSLKVLSPSNPNSQEYAKVTLRVLEPRDFDSVMRWMKDEFVTRYLSQAFIYAFSKTGESRWVEGVSARSYTDNIFAVETVDGELVGSAGLHKINWIDRKAELAVMIGEKALWNRGYGTQTVQEMLRLGFIKMNLRRIYLRVSSNHLGAIHLYEKCGFQREGLLREDTYAGRCYEDTLLMAVLKKEIFGKTSDA